MNISTDRLIIRDVRETDAESFIVAASDGSLNDVGFDKDCASWMPQWVKEAKELTELDNPNGEYLAYTVALKESGEVVGSVGTSYYEDLKEIGITYFICGKYRGNGYAHEAVKAYTEHFFNHYEIEKLIATVRKENTASWKVVEKCGFVLKKEEIYKDINDEEAVMYRFYEKTKQPRLCGKN